MAATPACTVAPTTAEAADDTLALQTSIDQCAAQGGGHLQLEGRVYRIGPIQLRSKVYLVLDAATVLQGTEDKSRYEAAFIGWPYKPREALISGYQISDAGILGAGRIDGNGQLWWAQAKVQRKDGTMARLYPDIPASNGMPRPWLVEFFDSQRITIDGPTMTNSPMWNLVLRYSQHVQISNLTVRNPENSANTDGIDVVASQHVTIRHVDISTGDDNIALKSGLAGSTLPAQATAHVEVKAATFGSGHGLSIGSETIHGVQDIALDDVHFDGTDYGFRLKTGRDRGNNIGPISIRNSTMRNVQMAISVTAYYPNVPDARDAAQPVGATTPQIHDISIENLQASANVAGRIVGLPESPVRGVRLHNVHISANKGLTLRDTELLENNAQIQTLIGPAVIPLEGVRTP
ncbi:hypothetical protein KIK84_01085 [Curvibacter sp. CHRR-16]|uniref:glycoside hydrolase family 28 protein n=1 Tax=Curvibacter sp. CHRR-16 TaxID=2835872 RepID=UPI001BDAB128|nr:glycosyl hydrolase family 28 protein [Curvibacter sp. CHRR-16]MBT0568907.1 hypothetical protein [Curvibacter sp. CHRR-16]